MSSPALDLILRGAPRARFLRELGVLLVDPRLVWLASSAEALTVIEASPYRRTMTYDAAPGGRLSPVGQGYGVSFNGTSQYLGTPDSSSLSFGNGTTDQAFSIVQVVNVTDTAAERAIVSKYNASNREWYTNVNAAADKFAMVIYDESAGVLCQQLSNSAVTQGAWIMLSGSYSGVGGASAGNGIALYQNGVAMASTVTNNASYVAMEDLGASVEIGTLSAHTASWFSGSMALVAVAQKNLSAAEHAAIYTLCQRAFGI